MNKNKGNYWHIVKEKSKEGGGETGEGADFFQENWQQITKISGG